MPITAIEFETTDADNLDQIELTVRNFRANAKDFKWLTSKRGVSVPGGLPCLKILCGWETMEGNLFSNIIGPLSQSLTDVNVEVLVMGCELLPPLVEYDLNVNINDVEHTHMVLQNAGMAISQTPVIDSNVLEKCREAVDGRITKFESAMAEKHPEIDLGKDAFKFKEVASRSIERFDLCFELEEGGIIADLAESGPWMALVKDMLGNSIHWAASVVYSKPGATDQDWHADGPHIGKIANRDGTQKADNAYSLCIFLPTIDLSIETGFTQFWPGTHHYDVLGLGGCASKECLDTAVDGIVEAGRAVMYDYRTVHRGIGNSSDLVRPVLQFLYFKDCYEETYNYGDVLLFSQEKAVTQI